MANITSAATGFPTSLDTYTTQAANQRILSSHYNGALGAIIALETTIGITKTLGSVLFAGAGGNYAEDNTNLFWHDTDNQLRLAATGSSAGILIGGDAQWYRSAANVMRTPDSLIVDSNTTLTGAIISNLIFTDDTYDIGASGATRPRNLFLSGDATIGDQLIVSGVGPHAIGGATLTSVQLGLRGSFTGTGPTIGFRQDGILTGAVGQDIYGHQITTTFVEAASGTHENLTGLMVNLPNVTLGGATVSFATGIHVSAFAAATGTTNASGIRIEGPPTGASNNYSLWVDDGSVRIDGTTGAGVGAGTLTNAPSAGDPDIWIPLNANGTQYWVPGWAA